mgnify:CR=1 FL=1
MCVCGIQEILFSLSTYMHHSIHSITYLFNTMCVFEYYMVMIIHTYKQSVCKFVWMNIVNIIIIIIICIEWVVNFDKSLSFFFPFVLLNAMVLLIFFSWFCWTIQRCKHVHRQNVGHHEQQRRWMNEWIKIDWKLNQKNLFNLWLCDFGICNNDNDDNDDDGHIFCIFEL